MDRRKKIFLILTCIIAAAVIWRFTWIHAPSEGAVVIRDDASGININEPLSKEELTSIKSILWGKVRWPEWLYGHPACGFGRGYAIIIGSTRYMLAWDSCGVLCVESVSSDAVSFSYIDISDADRNTIEEIISSRNVK